MGRLISNPAIEEIVLDLRYALRALRRSPAFSLVAVLTLALGIASTTAAFSIVDTVVLRGLPYGAADRLHTIYERSDDGNLRTPSYPTFRDWQTQSSTAADAIDGFAFVRGDGVSLPGRNGDEREIVAYVSPGFFQLMGTRPLLGRTFLPDEERTGGPHVAVISYDLFVQRFGGDPAILGRTVDVDSVPTTIIGVMPRAFVYPNFSGGDSWTPTRLWQPLATFEAAHPAVLSRRSLHVDSRTLIRLHAGGERLMQHVRSGTLAAVGGTRERRVRNLLVSAQFALALTLLIGAGLLIQSFRRLAEVPLGYDPMNLITFAISPTSHRYDAPAQAAALYARILDALRAIPTVQDAAAAGGALLSTSVEKADAPSTGQPLVQALYHPVSTGYPRTMRIGMVTGRWFTDDDMRTATGLVINEKLARTLWSGASPIGKRITIRRQSQARADVGQPITLPIIGVTADVRQGGPGEDPYPEVFLPYTLEVWPWMNFVLRAPNAEHLLRSVTVAVRRTEPAIRFIGEPSMMQGGAAGIDTRRRFITIVLGGFAVGALLIAAIGLYGVVAYGVTQRTREIGVRIALGASEGRVMTMVMRDCLAFVLIGAMAGIAGAIAATRLIRVMLFNTTTTDPATFVIVTIVLALAALAAIYAPARRAARTDPTIAIRAE